MTTNFQIGNEVIRINANYEEKGTIVEIEGNRARIKWTNQWGNGKRTWCKLDSIGLTSEWEAITVREPRGAGLKSSTTKHWTAAAKNKIVDKIKIVRK